MTFDPYSLWVFVLQGDELTEENLTTKRPGDGASPMRWNEVVGTVARRDYKRDEKAECNVVQACSFV